MARDSQAALVALNRFGFGARGGASGDFINAASDPRGFVLAELTRPNGALLEVPGLLSTPELGKHSKDHIGDIMHMIIQQPPRTQAVLARIELDPLTPTDMHAADPLERELPQARNRIAAPEIHRVCVEVMQVKQQGAVRFSGD